MWPPPPFQEKPRSDRPNVSSSVARVRVDGNREESRALRRPLRGGGQARPPQQPDRLLGTSNLIGCTQHTSDRLNLAFRLAIYPSRPGSVANDQPAAD